MEFLDINTGCPGRTQDSTILEKSQIPMYYRMGKLNGILVGDSGYPCWPFLMIPFQNPQTDEQLTYNNIHSRTRIVAERAFGLWKRRFPCLSRGLPTDLNTNMFALPSTINACATLHNMALRLNDNLLEEEDDGVQEEEEVPLLIPRHQPTHGFPVRDALIARMFH